MECSRLLRVQTCGVSLRQVSLPLACAVAMSASCSLTGSAVAFRTSGAGGLRANTHVGAGVQAALQLPREYRALLAIEGAAVGQVDPAERFDQWRLALAGGYSSAPDATERIGYEITGRVGTLRGSSGPASPTGLFGGIGIAAPIRFGARKAPWEADDVLGLTWLVVPQVGLNAVRPSHQDWQWEPAVMLGIRFRMSSGVFP